MTEPGHILVNRETGIRYRICGCLQVFPDEEAAVEHRKAFTSGDPEEWEAVPVEVVDKEDLND